METKVLTPETLECLTMSFAENYLGEVMVPADAPTVPSGKFRPLEPIHSCHLRIRMGKDMLRSTLNAYGCRAVNHRGTEVLLISDMYEKNRTSFTWEDFVNKIHEIEPLQEKFVISSVCVEKTLVNGKEAYRPVVSKPKKHSYRRQKQQAEMM